MNLNLRGSRGGRSRRPSSEINITPFLDVMLVLLVIFMAIAPSLTNGIDVDLPDANSKSIETKDEPLIITIDKSGMIYIMDNKISSENLINKLKNITKEKMDTKILVRGDKSISYGEIISVIGKISKSGFSKVALVTKLK